MKQPSKGRTYRKRFGAICAMAAALLLGIMPTAVSAATVTRAASEQRIFENAAAEFHVPVQVLMAISYDQTRFEDHQGQMSMDGGYGVMDLRTTAAAEDGRGDPSRPIANKIVTPTGDMTLDRAAQLLHVSPDTLKNDTTQNVRGAAVLLADKAKQLHAGSVPTDLQSWYQIAAHYLGSDDAQAVQSFVDDLQGLMQKGASATTVSGQQLSIPATPSLAAPLTNIPHALGLAIPNVNQNNDGAECPKTDNCRFVSAGYAQDSSDPTDYGNYDHANRPKDMKINYIVIHDTEGSYASAISHFQDTHSYVSAHYVIRSSDGAVTQMVRTSDVAWHANDWYMNMHSIGIEHEGRATLGGSWYTEAMYRSSANLVRYLANKYNIPLNRQHIIGHDNTPTLTDARLVGQHWDPGPYWDWSHYMDLLHGNNTTSTPAASHQNGNIVTINPTMSQNVQTVSACITSDSCTNLTAPSNFVFLHVAPDSSSAYMSDQVVHPGQPGTNRIEDWTSKATAGEKFVLAGQQGDWTAIWYSNQKGWFYNPASQPTATIGNRGKTVTPKSGAISIPIYGGAYPETSVYPTGVNYPQQPQLSYTMSSGQSYVADSATPVPTDYFYDWTVDSSMPYDHNIFKGNDKFYKITYNQRVMFVRASDVVVQ